MRVFDKSRNHAALTASLTVAFICSMMMAISWSRQTVGVATFWPGAGILMAGLVVLPRRWAVLCAALCAGSQLAFNLVIGQAFGISCAFTFLCLGESLAAAWLARRIWRGRVRLNGLKPLVTAVCVVIAPVMALSSLVAAVLFSALFERNFNDFLTDWLIAHTLGAAMLFPAVMILVQRQPHDDFRRSQLEQVALLALVAAISVLALQATRLPAAMLLFFPVLMLMAFRLGPRGAATGALVMASVSFAAMVYQPEAMMSSVMNLAERIRYLQLTIATCFFTSLSAAVGLSEAARIRRLWAARARIASMGGLRAAAAARAKQDFLAAMSHEIRAPMNSIIGFTQVLLRRDDLPQTAQRQLVLVDRAGASLLSVVNDILDLSQLEASGVELKPRVTTPQAIAQEALAIVAERARRKGLGVELTLAGPVDERCRIDDLRLRQTLLTLLGNALKFTQAGHLRLDVSARAEGDGVRLRFAVTDTGPGIAPDRLGKLFDRFAAADAETGLSHLHASSGSSFGLAIAKGLIELLGGEIGVQSAEGHGSTFWIEAPAERVAADDPAVDPAAGGRLDARVLLVDDHPANRELGATVLDLLGCRVDVAEDGERAVEAARTTVYDAILMDVHMPRMNGLEAARAIRALGGAAGAAPIIAMTADVLPEQIERCRAAGMVDHLPKPIRLDDLHAALSRWVRRGPGADDRAA